MIHITLGTHRHNVPTRWDEIDDPGKFTALCLALRDFESGAIDTGTLHCRAALALCGADPSKIRKVTDEMSENIYRISELMGFLYTVREAPGGRRCAQVNICLDRNLLPGGYTFRVLPSGLVDCDITAEQYIDAVGLMQLYGRAGDESVLERLHATLYPKAECHSGAAAVAAYYNFRGILEFVRGLDAYALIFSRTSSDGPRPASPLGLSSTIFQLVKSGYGDLTSIRNLDLFTYLGTLVQMTVDSIHTCRAARLTPSDTAERLQLPVELVIPYFDTQC